MQGIGLVYALPWKYMAVVKQIFGAHATDMPGMACILLAWGAGVVGILLLENKKVPWFQSSKKFQRFRDSKLQTFEVLTFQNFEV